LYKKSQAEQYAIFNDEYLCGYNYNRESKSLTVTFFDRNSQNKLWQQTYENRVFPLSYYENLFLSDIRITFLEKIDLKTGKSEWILDFGMKVHGDILKFGDTLIIPLDNDHLLGINAATGEKLWELEDCLNYYCLEETTGLLYGYARERFEIIDAARGEKILRKQLTGSMDKYEISPDQSMNVLAGDAIYFVSNWKVSSKIGKINVRTQEIEFVQELIKEEKGEGRTLAGTPVYHNGRLYIKDSVGVLHIFEEE
jgi:outer membrane protein assembly factor BamB